MLQHTHKSNFRARRHDKQIWPHKRHKNLCAFCRRLRHLGRHPYKVQQLCCPSREKAVDEAETEQRTTRPKRKRCASHFSNHGRTKENRSVFLCRLGVTIGQQSLVWVVVEWCFLLSIHVRHWRFMGNGQQHDSCPCGERYGGGFCLVQRQHKQLD